MKSTCLVACLAAVLIAAGDAMVTFDTGAETHTIATYSTVERGSGKIYVGTTNALYQLDYDLKLQASHKPSKVLDSPKCPPYPGNCTATRTIKDRDYRVLEVDRDGNVLLACGTVQQGRCSVHYNLDDVSTDIFELDTGLVSLVGGRETVSAFFGDPPTRDIVHSKILYAAMTYDGRDARYSPPALTSRVLIHDPQRSMYSIKYLHEDKAVRHKSAIDLMSRYKKNFIVRYVYGFQYSGFTYFLAVSKASLDSGSQYETRLVRVCQNDRLYYSYVELPVKCLAPDGGPGDVIDYNLAQAAHKIELTESVSHKFGLGQSRRDVLFVTFTRGLNGSSEPDPTQGSSVCYQSLEDIEKAFQSAQLECYRNEVGHVVDWFRQPRQQCLFDPTEADKISGDVSYCGNYKNPAIQASVPNTLRYWFTYDHIYTALAVSRDNMSHANGLILGTIAGEIHKINLDVESHHSYAEVPLVPGSKEPINADWEADRDQENIFFLSGSKVVKFPMRSCSIYTDCGLCVKSLRRDSLDCGWCQDACTERSQCMRTGWTQSSCPPELKQFSPRAGPLEGGTKVTLTGRNFGGPQAVVKILVAARTCEIKPGGRNETHIVCETSHSPTEVTDAVEIEVVDREKGVRGYEVDGKDDSHQTKFAYKIPRMSGFSPVQGPKSGGTHVTIDGTDLDIGTSVKVTVARVPCVITSITSARIACRTSKLELRGPERLKRTTLSADTVKISIDMASVTSDEFFSYTEDPRVMNIIPAKSFVSGGLPIIVDGSYLHVVAQPQLVLDINGTKFTQVCNATKAGHRMRCISPNVTSLRVRPTEENPAVALISFIMDDVKYLREYYNHSIHNSRFYFYPDPIFYPFEKVMKLFEKDKYITIQGKYLTLGVGRNYKQDIKVWIEKDACNITSLTNTTLMCTPHKRPAEVATGERNRMVVVEVGSLRFDVGQIKYTEKNLSLVIALCVGLVVLVIIGAIVLVLVYMKRTHQGPWKKIKESIREPPSVRYLDGEVVFDEEGNSLLRIASRRNDYQFGNRVRLSGRSGRLRSQTSMVDTEAIRVLQETNQLIKRDDLILGEIIGHGHFGCVFKGYLTVEGEKGETIVAVKSLQSAEIKDTDINKFLKEALIMKDFTHPNILQLFGITISDDSLPLIILPYMQKGDLLAYVRNEDNMPTVRTLMEFGKQIASGMAYLVEIKFVHRDLAARNCMLDDDSNVRVADFGLSRDIYERDYYSSEDKKAKLPIKWMAPESMEKGIYNHKTDMWSFGVTLWELLTRGVTPYPGVDNWDVLKYINQGRRMPQPTFCPTPLYQIMRQVWSENPQKRPTFAEMVERIDQIVNIMEDEENLYDQPVSTTATYVNLPSDDESQEGAAGVKAERRKKRGAKKTSLFTNGGPVAESDNLLRTPDVAEIPYADNNHDEAS